MLANLLSFGLVALLLRSAAAGSNFRWPDPKLDELEERLYTVEKLAVFVDGCFVRDISTVAAQWLRIAYHDMASHNTEDGTGGLDGSIVFELDRPQNVGVGMLASLSDFSSATNTYVGIADTIAMGAVLSVAACGGPAIPYRAGRTDATEAGPATVPEPHQDLQSHIASFERQGFNQSEMIALVACGHTLGGVRQDDFPLTVTNTTFANFDSTLQFDSTVVAEYLSGDTKNPLVVGTNTTTNSDQRIFSSDGNVTMQSLSEPDNFKQTCASLIERMVNTVPSQVTLTEVIEPIEYKVSRVKLYPKDGGLVLNATLRTFSSSSSNITMHWQVKEGCACPPSGCSISSNLVSTSVLSDYARAHGIAGFTRHVFSTRLDLNCSITKFWFEIAEANGTAPLVINNGGSGYQLDDTVLFDPFRSTLFNTAARPFRVVVGVRENVAADAKVSLQLYERGTLHANPFPPGIRTVELQADANHPTADGYSFFAADINLNTSSLVVEAVVGGKQHEQFLNFDDLLGPDVS